MSENIAHLVKTITKLNEYHIAMKSSNLVSIMFIDIPPPTNCVEKKAYEESRKSFYKELIL